MPVTHLRAQFRLAFTRCLQYTYSKGKNTADIALALDALEALFDHRAYTFCLVTSDSDFSYWHFLACGKYYPLSVREDYASE